MSDTWNRAGRPDELESARRKARFLTLIADGMTPRQAAHESRISMGRALDIVTHPDYPRLLDALRSTNPIAA